MPPLYAQPRIEWLFEEVNLVVAVLSKWLHILAVDLTEVLGRLAKDLSVKVALETSCLILVRAATSPRCGHQTECGSENARRPPLRTAHWVVWATQVKTDEMLLSIRGWVNLAVAK